MSRYGVPVVGATGVVTAIVTVEDRHDAPWCDSEACYLHLSGDWDGEEHHAEGCPVYGTAGQAQHRLSHELVPVMCSVNAAIDALPWPQRIPLRMRMARARVASRLRRFRWRLVRR